MKGEGGGQKAREEVPARYCLSFFWGPGQRQSRNTFWVIGAGERALNWAFRTPKVSFGSCTVLLCRPWVSGSSLSLSSSVLQWKSCLCPDKRWASSGVPGLNVLNVQFKVNEDHSGKSCFCLSLMNSNV